MKAKHLRSSSMMPSNEASYIPPVIYLGQRAVDRQKYKENRVRQKLDKRILQVQEIVKDAELNRRKAFIADAKGIKLDKQLKKPKQQKHTLKLADLTDEKLEEYRMKFFERQNNRHSLLEIEQLLPSFISPEKAYEREIQTLIDELKIQDGLELAKFPQRKQSDPRLKRKYQIPLS